MDCVYGILLFKMDFFWLIVCILWEDCCIFYLLLFVGILGVLFWLKLGIVLLVEGGWFDWIFVFFLLGLLVCWCFFFSCFFIFECLLLVGWFFVGINFCCYFVFILKWLFVGCFLVLCLSVGIGGVFVCFCGEFWKFVCFFFEILLLGIFFIGVLILLGIIFFGFVFSVLRFLVNFWGCVGVVFLCFCDEFWKFFCFFFEILLLGIFFIGILFLLGIIFFVIVYSVLMLLVNLFR